MAHGIESRAPFLDHRIAEFVFSRPTEWRLQGYKLKGALRKVARGIVPDPIIDRGDKMGFPVPLKDWTPEWNGTQRELWQAMSLAAWSRVFTQERQAA
jgi:asparagine synthetase B (glutamine-hydrolysing)